jgi:hypothetical protein
MEPKFRDTNTQVQPVTNDMNYAIAPLSSQLEWRSFVKALLRPFFPIPADVLREKSKKDKGCEEESATNV